jgi:hypothetical protein
LLSLPVQVAASAVILLEPGSIPKTNSNKIQRHKCRDKYLAGQLAALHTWLDSELPPPLSGKSSVSPPESAKSHSHGVLASPTGINIAPSPATASPSVGSHSSSVAAEAASSSPLLRVPEGPASAGPVTPPMADKAEEDAEEPLPAELLSPVPIGVRGVSIPGQPAAPPAPADVEAREKDFIERLVAYVVKARNIAPEMVDLDEPMSLFGFDSAGFVAMGKVMCDWVGKEISPAIVYKYTTIREIAGEHRAGPPSLSRSR